MAGADSLGYCGLFQGFCGLVEVFLPPRSGGVLAEKDGRTGPRRGVEIGSDPPVAREPRFDDRGEDLSPTARNSPAVGDDLCSSSSRGVRTGLAPDVVEIGSDPPVAREPCFDYREEASPPVAPAAGGDLCSSSDEEDSPPMSREPRFDDRAEGDLSPLARNSPAAEGDLCSTSSRWSAPDVVEISSDEDGSPTVARELRFDDQDEDLSPIARNSPVQQNDMIDSAEDDDDDDDCVILDGDPHSAVAVKGEKDGGAGDGGSDEELQIVAEKGKVACRDFPHSRHLCSNMPFGTTSHEKHCTMCYCFVCDAPAPCSYWGKALSVDDHCHATDKETKWKTLRQAFRCNNLPASHPGIEISHPLALTVSMPRAYSATRVQSGTSNDHSAQVARRGTSNTQTAQISNPLALTITTPRVSSATIVQSGTSNGHSTQVTHRVEPTVSAPRPQPVARAGRGTSNTQTAQISHQLALTVSAQRASSATRVQSGTSNGNIAQITRLVEPTVGAPRPHSAAGAGRGTSNTPIPQISHSPVPRASSATRVQSDTNEGHTAQVTRLLEPIVSAPRPHPAAGAGRGTSNTHNALITRPVEPSVSALRPYSATRTGSGTSNAHTSQITRSVEPTVSAIRGYPAGRTGSGISNAHTAPVTRSVEQTVGAPRVYPAVRAGSDSINGHSGQITYPATATPDAPEGTTVYVGNLPYHIDNERLKLSFQDAGVVLFSKVIYDRETGQSRGFGFVTMSTVQEAETAVRIYHGSEVYGSCLTVNIAAPRGGAWVGHQSGSRLRIFVCNLPSQVDHSRLKELFSKHGKVVDARVVYERREGACCSRGFGFVRMATEEESHNVIRALNKQILEGHALVVKVASELPQRGGLSLSNQIPLQTAASQNQNTHTSVRAASPNVAPSVRAPRAYPATRARSGASNAYTAQVTRRLDPSRSS